MEQVDVVVVGSGPNGLAAAVTMARSGLEVTVVEAQDTIGGGARTLDLGLHVGMRHDVCSAVHPMALASPFLRRFDLRARGVELAVPDLSYAQPLDGSQAGLAWHDLDRTVAGLERDGPAWRRLLEPLVERSDAVVALTMGDKRSVPREVLDGVSGVRAAIGLARGVLTQGTRAWNREFDGDVAPALLTGVAAHAIAPVPGLAPAGAALLLATLAHSVGWPIPVGGSQSIIDALAGDLLAHGGSIRTGTAVRSWRELPAARAYLLDTSPRGAATIWEDRLAPRTLRSLRSFRYGDAAAKVDFVLSGPVPWRTPEVGQAGTVHVGGTRSEMAAAEAAVADGRHAERPMVLLSDPTTADATRGQGGLRPLWTYAHVPHGSDRDVTEDVTRQIERFAPGFRDLVVTSRCVPASAMEQHNANYIGGDIASGAVTLPRILTGVRPAWNPYELGVPGVYLCSSSVPPGPGVHGMGGWFAARHALRQRFGISRPPELAP